MSFWILFWETGGNQNSCLNDKEPNHWKNTSAARSVLSAPPWLFRKRAEFPWRVHTLQKPQTSSRCCFDTLLLSLYSLFLFVLKKMQNYAWDKMHPTLFLLFTHSTCKIYWRTWYYPRLLFYFGPLGLRLHSCRLVNKMSKSLSTWLHQRCF